jgi:threonine dehydrogenase-like Zn-dependent dehydrogenase
MRFFGSASADPHVDAGFREYVPLPVGNVYVLPESMTVAEGTLMEPLAVAVLALRRARTYPGR